MSQFNNEEYRVLVSDLIGDVYYTSTSYRGKISTLRQYRYHYYCVGYD